MQQLKSFGIRKQTQLSDNNIDKYVEELTIQGFSVMEGVLDEAEIEKAKVKLDEVYQAQVKEFSEKELGVINELHMARFPFVYDEFFLKLITNEKLVNVLKAILGNYFTLHLQNGIINMPQQEHHQNSWHRDLPYQDYTSSYPLAISALYTLDKFDASTGGTVVLPFSHKLDRMPSMEYIQKHTVQTVAKPGSVIFFDSMVFHKAGYNSSNQIRRGVNHMFTAPILKQQINVPAFLDGKYSDDPFLRMVMGYDVYPPNSVYDWRKARIDKMSATAGK
jgi:ectoine hydroxylase-related dioxygenase (phytanoyl-CoA dioxygenase family)